jgi:predicted CopG family antitoxin
MAKKTITLKLDAYEKLRNAKRGSESFTKVVRRAVWTNAPATGESLLNYFRNGGSAANDKYLDVVEEAAKHQPSPDVPRA